MKLRLPISYYNPVSYAGTAIALISLFMFIFLYVLSSISASDKAYVGLVIFVTIPAFIILGLLLIPLGMYLKVRKQKKSGGLPEDDFPILNLNLKNHRTGFLIFSIGTVLFLFLSALGSYEAYHYTESVEFCGTLCHEIMVPEYTAFQNSPHAKVGCAECHIGGGASWWVKSKMSGLYQVYATLANNYPRPIPTPVENLRPARETCEECHWPQKVYGKSQRQEIYYLPDEENTRWEINLLMNTGGGNPALGHSSGIHWHINPDIEIEYITTDEKRETIPIVFLIDKVTGDTTIYENEYEPYDAESAEFSERRTMDCIDCHNRPSHIYREPTRFINIAIASGEISTELPLVKQAAIEACVEEYATSDSAMLGIEQHMRTFYEENYPEIAAEKNKELEQSILGVQNAFSKNIFPGMKVRWEAYPEHIGHFNSPGCYRCHDGNHVSTSGDVVTHTCDDCHLITAQGKTGELVYTTSDESLPFEHPVDIDGAWQEFGCYECHATPPI